MIKEVTYYNCVCDNCGKQWSGFDDTVTAYSDKDSMECVIADDTDWYTECGVVDCHYCPDCFGGLDEDDKIILRESCKA